MKQHRQQRGLTLVELMIAMAIGVLLLLGVSLLFSQNRQSYRQNEEIARIQENARFALDELGRDIAMAGFFAEIVNSGAVTVQADLPTKAPDCDNGTAWLYSFVGGLVDGAVRVSDQVADGAAAAAAFDCIAAGADFRPGTDIVGIRRTAGVPSFWDSLSASGTAPDCSELTLPTGAPCSRAVPARGVFVRENSAGATIYHGADGAGLGIPLPYEDWEYTPRVYYVRDVDVDGDAIPHLCRQRLDNGPGGPTFFEECLVQGVEDMQVELGVDADGDGAADAYVSNPTVANLQDAVSMRVYLLMRAIDIDVGHEDQRTYTLGNTGAGPYTVGPFNDRFHRRVYTTTVTMRNLNNIRRLGF